MRLNKGVIILHLFAGDHIHLQAHRAGLASNFFKLHGTFFGVPQTQRTRDMIIHRVVDLIREATVHLKRIALHVHHGPIGRKVGAIARRMPCRSRRQLILFKKHTVRPTFFGEMVKCGDTHNTAPNNNNPRCRWKIHHV